ncbi:MAG: hypothetical protein ACR2G3_12605 [Solirubrobacterales bacterium]
MEGTPTPVTPPAPMRNEIAGYINEFRWVILIAVTLILIFGYLTASAAQYQACVISTQVEDGDPSDCSRWNPLPT